MKRLLLAFAAVLIIGTVNAQNSRGTSDNPTTLIGNEESLDAGWYKVGKDNEINFTQTLTLSGDVHLILEDGYVMNVGTKDESVNGIGIKGTTYNLNVSGSGTLNVYASSYGISVKSLTLDGGTVNVNGSYGILASGVANEPSVNILGGSLTATGSDGDGITANQGYISISGGIVEANGEDNGISCLSGTIVLAGGTVTANSYYEYGSITVAPNIVYSDGTNSYSGSINTDVSNKPLRPALLDATSNTDAIEALKGEELASITLHGRTLYKDGCWNTLCLPFDVTIAGSVLDGNNVDVRTLTSTAFSNGTLTLNFTDKGAVTKLDAGKPYIIKWSKDSDSDPDLTNLVNPTFSGVTVKSGTTNVETEYVDFVGTYSPVDIYTAEKTNLYLGTGNTLYYPWSESMTSYTINACRAYFQLKTDLTAGDPTSTTVRAFNLNFGDEDDKTGITTTDFLDEPSGRAERTDYTDKASAWYDLSGRNLSGKPTKKGLYINNGKLVVIK